MNFYARTMVSVSLVLWFVTNFSQGHPTSRHHHINHKRLKHARIKAIKQEILAKLGLSSVPDVSTANTTVEDKRKMLKLYRRSIQENQGKVHELFSDEEFYAKTFHSYTDIGAVPSGIGHDIWQSDKQVKRLFFPVDIAHPVDHRREVHVHSAQLKLYTSPKRRMDNLELIRLNLYQLLDVPVGREPAPRRLVDSRLVSLLGSGWVAFDVRPAVQAWLDEPGTNYGLEVACEGRRVGDLIDIVSVYNDEDDLVEASLSELYPTLDIYTQEKPILGRQKRSLAKEDCTQGDGETKCCRYPLWVSFAELGWDDWVLAPEGYQAYYCDGSCPYRHKLAHTFAKIQAEIHHQNPAAAPAPCCSASRLSALNLLHYGEDDHLMVSLYDDMIVEECRCE